MKQALNAFYWLAILALLIAGLLGCGLFKKSRQKDYSRSKTETVDKTVIVIDRSDSAGMKEQTVLELDIRIPKPKKGEDPSVPDSAISTITEAITAAIGKATRLKAKVSNMKEESRQGAENRQENRDFESRADSLRKSADLAKDSNTTWSANFPPWLILAIAAMLILAGFIYFKTKKPF